MAKPFHVEVLTPEKSAYSGDATMVVVRSLVGEIAFMAGHIPYIGALANATVKIYRENGEILQSDSKGGIVQVHREGGLTLATDSIDFGNYESN